MGEERDEIADIDINIEEESKIVFTLLTTLVC